MQRRTQVPYIKQFVDSESFKRWMADTVFRLIHNQKQSGS